MMKWPLSILASLAVACSVVAQAPNQAPLGGASPQATQSGFQEKAQGFFEQGKKLVNIYLGSSPVDFQARDESDKQAGVVRLTDENWDKEMAAWDGDWAIILHGHQYGAAISDPASTYFVEMHNNATRMAREYIASPPLEEDKNVDEKIANLKNVKWARIDYMTEWESCARWMVTRPPWLVFVSDHGKEIRFIGTRSISAEGSRLFNFMAHRNWESLEIWKPSPFYSKCAETYIKASQQISNMTQNIPSWVWFMVIPAVTQGLVKYIFFGGEEGAARPGTARAAGPGAGQGRGARPVPVTRKNA